MTTVHETEGTVTSLHCSCGGTWTFKDGAVEYKSGKPQPKQEQGEPVAIIHRNEYNEYRLEPHDDFDIKSIPFNVDVPLFKSPLQRQRTFVGLTEPEVDECYESIMFHPDIEPSRMSVYLEIEAKLKEKNT